MQDFGKALEQIGHQLMQAAADGVGEACDELLSLSRDEIPYDQGDLSNSGKVDVEVSRPLVTGAVSFDTPYAVRQHEDTSLSHQDGRKAHYLGDPLRANVDRLLGHVADRMRDAIE